MLYPFNEITNQMFRVCCLEFRQAQLVPSLLHYCERNTSLKNQSFEEFTFVPISLISGKYQTLWGVLYLR